MFTVCTNCQTRFRVSSAQLKAAQGQVRCGKCHEVFDAFWALDGEPSEPGPLTPPPMPADAEAGLGTTQEPVTGNDEAVDPPSIRIQAEAPDAPPELDTVIRPATEWPPEAPPALKAGPRRNELPPIDDLFGDLGDLPDDGPTFGDEPTISEEPDTVPPTTPELSHIRTQGPKHTPAPEHEHEMVFNVSVPAADLPQHPRERPSRPLASASWWTGIFLLALLLGLQLVNADREALAQNPVVGPSLMALYASLGRPLPSPRSVSAWDVSGLNVTSDPQSPGVLSITGTLENQAAYSQAWPYLRVELTDRFGQTLRGRDFKPADYLPATQSNLPLPAGQAVRIRIDIADPGPDAVGFTLAPCLDLPTGRVCSAAERD